MVAYPINALNQNIHIYAFVDERAPGWGSDFLNKAQTPDNPEWNTLLDSVMSYEGYDLWKSGQLTVVFPRDWMSVFRLVNEDPTLLRPSLNWIAEEYLAFRKRITARPPEGEKQSSYALDNWDNYYVVYYVATEAKRIVKEKQARQP